MGQIIGYIVVGLLGGITFFAMAVVLSALMGIPTWLLWNSLMPELFGLKTITWVQAWGLNVLCALLFKSSSTSSSS